MKQILALFLLTALLPSCKKSSTDDSNGNYTITGIVLDVDSKTALAAAKVYVRENFMVIDSAISDANGRVSFTFKKEGNFKSLYPTKDNYLLPHSQWGIFISGYVNRTDTVYLARKSFVNVTVHKTGTYLPLDSIDLKVAGDYYSAAAHSAIYRSVLRDKADAADRALNLYSWYFSPYSTKIYFQWDIIRSGAVISSQSDSTTMIQFGIKNFTLNY